MSDLSDFERLEYEPLQRQFDAARRERDRYRAALQMIADQVYPATYVGETKEGVKLYGGSGDASEYARRILAGENVT